ncbi:hypothetical protein BDB00DRAFT_786761 [Zychaea mexicana]|uniref:uncharacterized protein n=1 Tax=Zychaea mexicana TaxID=64656 RepID=UPI0022FF274F|nr:uncharacterized protein BDB00DRAFT_786761 [Zychaea mexicana]KAI9494913.1 hypothetical protein BDB00DRAFT_786761 [Zychaea mexicana]
MGARHVAAAAYIAQWVNFEEQWCKHVQFEQQYNIGTTQERASPDIDVTTGRAAPLQPVPKGGSSSEPATADQMQKQEEQEEAAAEDTADESDSSDQFFRRSSIRAVNFNPSATSLDKPKTSGAYARSWCTVSSQEDRLKVGDSEDNLDPKGKRPILQRLRSFEREPPFSSLRPGKDASSRKSTKSPNSSSGSAEKFVLTVTDTGGGAEHKEIYPIHPAETKPGDHDPQQQHLSGSRPRLFRRVSDLSSQPWSKDKSIFQHVWSRGASPSKSIKIAKQFAGRVGDTSLVKSINRHSTSPVSDDLLDSLSPPRSIPVSSASPESIHSQIYACPLDARPQKHRTAKRRSYSLNVPPTQLQSSMAKELMLDDFGIKHWVEPGLESTQLSEKSQEVIRCALMTTEGFTAGSARVIYIRGWDQIGTDRLVVREESWDIDDLLQNLMRYL